VNSKHIRELESLVLRIVQPRGNRQVGKFTQAENLRLLLAREIRAHHARELNQLLGRVKPRRIVRTAMRSSDGSRKPDLLGWFLQPTTLRGWYKDAEFDARVRRDGRVRFDGKVYDSVSDAASDACGRRRNGWWFWCTKNRRGEWVRLRDQARH